MKDLDDIVGLLRAVAGRMRVARVLHEAGFALCIVLFALAAFELVRIPLSGIVTDVHWYVLVAGLSIFCVAVLWWALKRISMAQAASLVDARLPLHDELKSAYWFASRPQPADGQGAAFVRNHVANAARTAHDLRGSSIVPLKLPRTLLLAVLPGLILAGAIWSRADLVRAGTQVGAGIAQVDTSGQSARSLLSATAADDEEIAELDRALAAFEDNNATRQERLEAMLRARDAVDQMNMQAAVSREGLARMARAISEQPGMEQVAEAIAQGRTEDAIAMLQEMRDELTAFPADGPGDGSGRGNSARTARDELPAAQETGETGRDVTNMPGSTNPESVNRLLENLENAQDTMRRQQRANTARRRMDELGEMVGLTAQNSDLAPQQFTNQGETPMGAPSPDTGQTDLRSATMYRQASTMPGDNDQDDEGSRTGGPSGHSSARALEGRATKRLDAMLKLERVSVSGGEEAKEQDKQKAEWFYSASQQEQSETGFADVRGRDEYSGADVMKTGRVPIEQRQAVRDYFINVHEGDNK
jgi:hypothetical protein